MSGTRGRPRRPARVERVQTGLRMRRSLLKAVKALAETYDVTTEELVEHVVSASFAGRAPLDAAAQARAAALMRFYGVELDAGVLPALVPRGAGSEGEAGPRDASE